MIKRYKNGTLILEIHPIKTIQDVESFYHDEIFMEGLNIDVIDYKYYIFDFDKNIVYPLDIDFNIDPTRWIMCEIIEKNGVVKFYPLNKKESLKIIKKYEIEMMQ